MLSPISYVLKKYRYRLLYVYDEILTRVKHFHYSGR